MTRQDEAITAGREFHFTSQDFQRVRKLIYDHAGISLSESKQELVYSRLSRRLRATGIKTFAEYLNRLEKGDEEEWEAFTNSLTTNLTAFFREAHHFPMLADYLRAHRGHPIVLWCSAASTGEEPYSMAITAAEVFGTLTPPVTIIASDLDTHVLEQARMGVYPEERVSKMDPDLVKRYFLRGTGSHAGKVRVREELRNLITFRQINLLHDDWPLRSPLDIIFCRNVMIYFDKPTQLQILKKFVPLLRSDGLMFAGHSENFYHAEDLFKLRSKTVYELAPKLKAQRHHEESRARGGHHADRP
ncbi:MAG: chemotaxis protein CheR [Nitrosomonadales bacterium]|nr:chemotaxis protein CheR [Nitrosomonadales bacterium]